MYRSLRILPTLALVILVGAIIALPDDDKEIPLSWVPDQAMEAAKKAAPGIQFVEAERHRTHKGVVYELDGVADGKKVEVNVTADGEVLKITRERETDPNRD